MNFFWSVGAGLWLLLAGSQVYRFLNEPIKDNFDLLFGVAFFCLDIGLFIVYATRGVIATIKSNL